MPRPDMNDPHELLLVDIERTAAHPLRPLVEKLRDNSRRRQVHHLGWDDPIEQAAQHLTAALVALRQARVQRIPGSTALYEAVLAVAGGLAKRFPRAVIVLPEQRTGSH